MINQIIVRSDIELLTLLRDSVTKYLETGLCLLITRLYQNSSSCHTGDLLPKGLYINVRELARLTILMNKHAIVELLHIPAKFWFTPGDKQTRIDFLNNAINNILNNKL